MCGRRFLIGLLLVCLVGVGQIWGATVRNATEEKKKELCLKLTPCGWAVYDRYSIERRIDYFMKNTCDCPADKKCLRTDDDISISAYVYRCKADA